MRFLPIYLHNTNLVQSCRTFTPSSKNSTRSVCSVTMRTCVRVDCYLIYVTYTINVKVCERGSVCVCSREAYLMDFIET